MRSIIFGFALVLSALSIGGSENARFDQLTGVIKKNAKALSPCILNIDGGGHSIGLRGDVLKEIPDKSRIWVQGELHTVLYDDRADPNPAMMPLQWHIYMDVKAWKGISKAFDKPKD